MVTPGLSVADIGCDHGFVAIYLVTQRQAPKAIAMDVNEGPLIRAREHIEQYGLSDIIEVRLSDGAQKLTVGETQAAIIAGMGGRLTVRIIEQSREVFAGMKEFVLSPQSDIAYVRKYLYSAGFVIEAEDMVYDEGKYYMIMRCRHSSETGELTEEQALVKKMVRDMAIKDIELTGKHEKEALKALGCGDSLDYNFSDTMVDILRHQAAITPDATAIVFKERSMTYAEVDSLTDRLACHLKSMGVGKEQAVGVMIERSELMLVYPMAIMKAGGAYMPLDPHFPEERLSFMCEDAGVKLILTEGNLLHTVMPSFAGKVFVSSDLASLPELKAPFKVETKTDDAAVILFTSGSTGASWYRELLSLVCQGDEDGRIEQERRLC